MTFESIMIQSIRSKLIRSGRPKITQDFNQVPLRGFVIIH